MAKGPQKLHPQTLFVHGLSSKAQPHGAMVPPVALSTSFEAESAEAMAEMFEGKRKGHLYSRLSNPTVEALEARFTDVLGARGSLAVTTGMSAVTLALLALLKGGDELIAGKYLFGGNYTLLNRTLPPLGIQTRFVDPANLQQAAQEANANTKAVFLEAIANPAMAVPDLAAWRAFCDERQIPLILDATLLTPCLYDNKLLQADIAIFSTTKYIAGAATSLGGLVVDTGRMEWHTCKGLALGDFKSLKEMALLGKLRRQMMADIGPALAPMTAFMLLTGMESLPLRLEAMCQNSQQLAEYLEGHPKVAKVHYPGLKSHPGHTLAHRQYQGRYGGLLSFELAGRAECFSALNKMALIRRSTNIGDSRTLALHPASTIYAGYWPHELELVGVTEGMIRLSVGIEDPRDLIAELAQALG